MSGVAVRIFFPILERKGGYPTREDGAYYGYATYRSYVAADCLHRCVYCDASDAEVESMQIDHFRPESFVEFAALVNDPLNLHYACSRCNRWKWDHWPAQGTSKTHDGENGFIDPFEEDQLEYFEIMPDGQIEPIQPPAAYIIKLLHLRREFMRKLREKRLLMAELRQRRTALKEELESDLESGRRSDPKIMIEFLERWERIEILLS